MMNDKRIQSELLVEIDETIKKDADKLYKKVKKAIEIADVNDDIVINVLLNIICIISNNNKINTETMVYLIRHGMKHYKISDE